MIGDKRRDVFSPPPPVPARAARAPSPPDGISLVRKIDTRNFQRATRTTPKEINRQIVLNLVREYQPISRADLARRMEVARGVVTPIVNHLIAEGLIYEGAVGNSPRGRKPTLLHVRSADRLIAAADVRLSETQVMLSDFAGRVIAMEVFATPSSPEALVGELAARIVRVIGANAGAGACEGIGLVVPGMVDRQTGRLVNAPTLGWRDVDPRAALQAATGIPVHIERDAVACALARMWLGHREGGDGPDNFAYVTISDGVGAGLVVNGAVVRGQGDTAGEFGHIPLTMDGPACLCGSHGCWEAYASNPAIVARYLGRELLSRAAYGEVAATGLTVSDVVARARSGDAAARGALEATGRYIGHGLAAIVNALNPARIIVGGEVAAAWDLVGPSVHAVVSARTLTAGAAATPVIPEPHDQQTRLRGAAALVMAPHFAAPVVG